MKFHSFGINQSYLQTFVTTARMTIIHNNGSSMDNVQNVVNGINLFCPTIEEQLHIVSVKN